MDNIEKAALLFQNIEKLRPLSAEDEQRIMQKFRLDWNYHSNHLEGNQLTFGETKALILFNITAQGKPLKDHIEMTGHNEALEWIFEVIKEQRPLTENFIRQLHELLLKERYQVDAVTSDNKPTKKWVEVGKYKTEPNHVLTKTGEVFRFATPEETPVEMHDLLEWYVREREKSDKNPILLATEFHYRFIRIHPFDDGNGRLARILMNFILMSSGYPPIIIKTEDKENYISTLQLADSGQFDPFVDYIAVNLVYSLELMIKGAKGEQIEEPDDLDKEIILLGQKIKSFGQKTKKPKNLKHIQNFYKDSIGPLYRELEEKMVNFKDYYNDYETNIWLNCKNKKRDVNGSYEENKLALQNWTGEEISEITIFQYFKELIIEFHQFKHYSLIQIRFKPLHIEVESIDKKNIVNLLYGESLTNAQIQFITRAEANYHKAKIEEFLKSISKEEE